VKQLILSGESPDNIAVIAPNSAIASMVMEEFDDALIPYRSSGREQLVESQIVKILLQPMQAVENDFSSEDLLAIIESPLVPSRALTMDEVEDFFRRYGYFPSESVKLRCAINQRGHDCSSSNWRKI